MKEFKYTAKVKYNGNHFFAGELVHGYYLEDKTHRGFIRHEWENEYGAEFETTVEIDKNTLKQCEGV